MKKIIFICFTICIVHFCAFAQNKDLQLLKQQIINSKSDTAKIKLLNNLSYNYFSVNIDTAQIYLLEALKLSEKINDKAGIALCYNNYGRLNYQFSQYEKALGYFEKALQIRKELDDSKGIAIVYLNIGNIYKEQGIFATALDYYQQALTTRQKLKDELGIASCFNNIAIIYESQGLFPKALESYQSALKIREKLNDKKGISESFNNIGGIHFQQSNFSKATEYFEKSLKISEELNDKQGIYGCFNNLGLVYDGQRKYNLAIEFYQKAMKNCEERKDSFGLSLCMNNIGYANENQAKYQIAIDYYNQALNNFNRLGNSQYSVSCLINIANCYYKLNQFEKTIKYSNESAKLADKIGLKDELRISYKNLYESHKVLKHFEKALYYNELFKELNDTLFNNENSKKINQIEIQYKFEKQQQEKDLEYKINLEKQRFYVIALIGVVIFFLIISIIIFRFYRLKKRDNVLLELQKNEILIKNQQIGEQLNLITAQNTEIKASIHYASRIQNAMLPNLKVIEQFLPENFILFKPRDIVSGDFFWYSAIQNNDSRKLVITVADCTGHGVPGAFMSLLGISFLNEIVNKNNIVQANIILNELRKNIKNALHQTGKDEEQKDGMDISLIVIDFDKKIVEYAGANNSMYLIRNKELIEYKADRMPIGIHIKEKESFTNHCFEILPNDSLYLFSDGYQDQFSEDSDKKFLAKNFRNLLLCMQDEKMVNQKEILNMTIEKWKGKLHQIDDITVMGIKIN